MTSFRDLGLTPETLRAVEECGYTQPTPIQEKAIPSVLMMRDIIGLAQTGTGKTASFTLPMIDILSGGQARAKMPRSLILSPTRELAAQISENFEKYGKYHKLTMALLVGGTSMGEQIKKLERGVDVLIATPGRMLDLFDRGQILLTGIEIFVIDEADRMLDMGFIPDIEKISGFLPVHRQTLLFSATMAPEIKKLADKFLKNPKEISVSPPASPAETVKQSVYKASVRHKKETLLQLIRQEDVKNAFVFCNRKKDIDGLKTWLTKQGLKAGALHGDMVQAKRTETLDNFKKGEIIFLICSDVVARGIDIQGVSHVFNYDVPFNPDDYVHRIGRTGRAGLSGRALMLYTDGDEKFLDSIQKRIKRTFEMEEISVSAPPSARDTAEKAGSKYVRKEPRKGAATEASVSPAQRQPARDDKPRRERVPAGDRHDGAADSPVGFGDDVPDFFKIKSA